MIFSKTDYSIFHNYHYESKSILVKFLDFASSPVRELFGGKNICLINEKENAIKLPIVLKLSAIAILTFALPGVGSGVVAISLTAFLFKVLFVKFSSEIKKIDLQFEKIAKNQSNKNFSELDKPLSGERATEIQNPANDRSQDETIDRQMIIAEFFELVNEKNDHRIIELYKIHDRIFKEVSDAQKAYADAILNQFKTNKKQSLEDAGKLLGLISDDHLLIAKASELIFNYIDCSGSKPLSSNLGGVHGLFTTIKLKTNCLERYCRAILKTCAITNEIDVCKASQKELLQVLVIEETVSILEKISNHHARKRFYTFKKVKNFQQDKVADIRSFLETLYKLDALIKQLKRLVKEKNWRPFRKIGLQLVDVAETMKFPRSSISALLQVMSLFFQEKIEPTKKGDEIEELKRSICTRLETLFEPSSPFKPEGFVLAAYYMREHPRLVKGLNAIKDCLFFIN